MEAFSLAREQRARSLELRVAIGLSRLWKTQNKQDKTHKPLAEVYSRFVRDAVIADVLEAKSLLDELT